MEKVEAKRRIRGEEVDPKDLRPLPQFQSRVRDSLARVADERRWSGTRDTGEERYGPKGVDPMEGPSKTLRDGGWLGDVANRGMPRPPVNDDSKAVGEGESVCPRVLSGWTKGCTERREDG